MDPIQNLMVVFTGIVAVALLLQSLAFWGIYKSMQSLSSRIDRTATSLSKATESFSRDLAELVETVRALSEKFRGIEESVSSTTEIVQKRVVQLDGFLEETTDAARLQVARIQEAIDTASQRVEETFGILQHRVLAPVNEVSAIITGIRVALDVLTGRRRRPVNPSRQDEEMFI